MFNYLQKYFLVFLFIYMQSIVAMENNKTIIPTKPTFTPTANTHQANTDLLNIIEGVLKNPLREENWDNITECLKNQADPNLKFGSLQDRLIYLAAKHGKKDLFDYLLQLGADINATNIAGLTPLHNLVNLKNITRLSVEYLLKNNADPNTTIYTKKTPLINAIESGDEKSTKSVKSLIQYKADINHKDNNFAPLGIAIQNKNIKIIKYLCSAAASLTNIDNYNQTVFHLAANESEQIIKALITQVSFKNDSNDTTNTIKTVLLVFNRLGKSGFPKIPSEIQILILSKLLSPRFFHTGLFKKCKKQLSLELVNEHIQLLQQILKIKNKDDKTALELAPKAHLYARKTVTEVLLDGSKLEKDLEILNAKYPDLSSIHPDNLVLEILKNHYIFESK